MSTLIEFFHCGIADEIVPGRTKESFDRVKRALFSQLDLTERRACWSLFKHGRLHNKSRIGGLGRYINNNVINSSIARISIMLYYYSGRRNRETTVMRNADSSRC